MDELNLLSEPQPHTVSAFRRRLGVVLGLVPSGSSPPPPLRASPSLYRSSSTWTKFGKPPEAIWREGCFGFSPSPSVVYSPSSDWAVWMEPLLPNRSFRPWLH